jgi:transposase
MSRPFGTPAELERRRRRGVELFDQGESPSVISRFLGVNRSSLYRWRKQADLSPAGLAARAQPHRPPRLSTSQLRLLEIILSRGAVANGWPNQLWTAARVGKVIFQHFGIRYHHDHVGRFLRQRLGWTPQKPRREARERDEEAILRWQSTEFPRIAKEAQQRGAHLVFLDESGYMLTPSVRRTWAPSGQTPVLKAWDRRDRLSAISSITVSPKTRQLNLYFDLLPDNRNVRAEDIVNYLRRLKEHLGGAITIVWDGSNVHDRSTLVRTYLAEHPEIVAERLPAYAPEMNPDELVWAWTKYSRLGNLAAYNTAALRDYIVTEMAYLRRHPEILASFIDHTDLDLPP